MSSAGAETARTRPPEWDHLELAVRRLLDDYDQWRRRALAAEQRGQELAAALSGMTQGTLDPLALTARVDALEAENRVLRERLEQARERVHRILGRLQFLQEDR